MSAFFAAVWAFISSHLASTTAITVFTLLTTFIFRKFPREVIFERFGKLLAITFATVVCTFLYRIFPKVIASVMREKAFCSLTYFGRMFFWTAEETAMAYTQEAVNSPLPDRVAAKTIMVEQEKVRIQKTEQKLKAKYAPPVQNVREPREMNRGV